MLELGRLLRVCPGDLPTPLEPTTRLSARRGGQAGLVGYQPALAA